MIGFFFRSVGLWVFAVGVVALVADIRRAFADGVFAPKPLGQQWFELFPASLNITQAAVQRHVAPWIWDPVIQWLLTLPAWLHFFVVGGLLYLLGRFLRRKPEVQLA